MERVWIIDNDGYVPHKINKDYLLPGDTVMALEKAKAECVEYHLKVAAMIAKMEDENDN